MTRDELKRSGLLDQYVLGLLGPEQSAEVEQLMGEDPFLQQEVDRLRGELDAYADSRNIGPPPAGRTPRTAEEFQDLDHEMITSMMERNHTLNIWRYVLIAACFLLIGTGGYLFRLKEDAQAMLVRERALHAQDDTSHRLDMERSREAFEAATGDWDNLKSFERPMDTGILRVHLLPGVAMALVDLSDVPPPPHGHAYYIFTGADSHQALRPEIVTPRKLSGLYAIKLAEEDPQLRIYQWAIGRTSPPTPRDSAIVQLPLPLSK